MEATTLGKRIRAARVLSDLSRDELGNLIDYSGDHVGAFERGAQSPRGPVLEKIAEATHQPLVFFTDEYEGLLEAAEVAYRKRPPNENAPPTRRLTAR